MNNEQKNFSLNLSRQILDFLWVFIKNTSSLNLYLLIIFNREELREVKFEILDIYEIICKYKKIISNILKK